ncbi:MAG TPA: hypothetical protein VFC21_05085 [Bryobacteraceae bacterium]|nr:hypothetical protein [Bryobacteraceae bacterium]
MRFLHIVSAITLVGGALAWRYAAIPGTATLSGEIRTRIDNAIAAAWRPFVISAILGILISGIYNFLHKTGLTPAYQAVFGIKILLVLHVLSVLFIATRDNNPKRKRQLTGVAISGVIIVILSAVLRWLTIA